MKFDKKIKSILNEMAHIAFNTPTQLIVFDFKIEKINNYQEMVNRVRNFIMQKKLNENEIQEFYNEIHLQRKIFNNLLKSKYPNIFTNQINENGIIEKLIKDIGF